MRILQLTSDWKWTGPAAPMLELLLALRQRGHEVRLACPEPPPGASGSLWARAREAGALPELLLARARGVRVWRDRAEARRLAALCALRDVEVVHAWHTRDHLLALRAGAGIARGGPALVRTYKGAAIPQRPWNRWLFGPGSDGLLCVSPGVARENSGLRGGRPIRGAFGAVDLQRFRPAPERNAKLAAELGIAPDQRVVGIVARVQRQRRFDLLLDAMSRLARALPDARLVVIGRGTHLDAVARAPARQLGIEDRVIFAGYRGDDYIDALRLCDVFSLLVPGSDGGCRALLEAAACGIPAVTTRRGALPELVVDGETGLLVDERPDALAAAWQALLADPARRARMGYAARERAARCFTPARFADAVLDLYSQALAR